MAIVVQCGECAKRYSVPDSVAGKKIRCKQCGGIIAVPAAPGDDLLPPQDLAALTAAAAPREPAAAPVRAAAAPRGPRPGGEPALGEAIGPTIPDGADAMSMAGDVEEPQVLTSRPVNALPRFPGNVLLDQFLPPLLAVTFGGWLVFQVPRDGTLPKPWLAWVRLLVYLGFYASIIFPITLRGVRAAAARNRFGLPHASAWRTFAAFLPPVALGCVFWIIAGTTMMLVVGMVVGLAVALGSIWFLMRVRPQQTASVLQIVATHWAIGTAVAVALVLGVNHATLLSMRGAKTAGAYGVSPLGPTLAWDPPAAGTPDATAPKTTPTVGNGPLVSAPGPATLPVPGDTAPQAMRDVSASGSAAPDPSSAQTSPTPEAALMVTSVSDVLAAVEAPAPEASKPAGPMVQSSLLTSAAVEERVGNFVQIVWPLTGAGSALLIRERQPTSDAVETWNLLTCEKRGSTAIQHAADVQNHAYVASVPDGGNPLLAQILSFPAIAVEIRSAVEDRVIRSQELDTARYGEPKLLGFMAPDQVAILWQKEPDYGIEFFDARGNRPKPLDLPRGFRALPGNMTISSDGRFLAVFTVNDGNPEVQVIERANPRAVRRFALKLKSVPGRQLDLAGLAFQTPELNHPEQQRVAALYEEQGKSMLVVWRPGDRNEIFTQVYFDPLVAQADRATEDTDRALEFVGDGSALLAFGRALVDATNGRLLGRITIDAGTVRSHRLLDRQTIAYSIGQKDGGPASLVIAKLDLSKLPAAPPRATPPAKGITTSPVGTASPPIGAPPVQPQK